MKSALSLFVIGVASVNAGVVKQEYVTSGTGANNVQTSSNLGPVSGSGVTTHLLPSGSAEAIAKSGGVAASNSALVGGWSAGASRNRDWEAQCDEDNLEECHHDIHIGAAGSGASGNAISNEYIVAAGEQVIPAQVI
jgi:hypothetical protein